MSTVPQARWYKGHLLFPVLDDNQTIEYWDVHENNGEHSSDHDPIAWGFSTLADAQAWVTTEQRYIRTKQRIEKMI